MNTEELNINGTRVWKFSSDQGVLGYLGIDSEIGGKSCGGLRFLPDLDAEEIAGLARAMTLKYGFLGLPQGGAKAGLLSAPGESEPERRQRLSDFGGALAPWLKNKRYFPGTDMGITLDDLNIILRSGGIRLKQWQLGCSLSGVYTAATVFAGIVAACRKKNRPIDRCTFALEGFGAVGSSLARFLHEAGSRITAVSTRSGAVYNEQGLDIPLLLARIADGEKNLFLRLPGVKPITREELLELPVDILSPCARHNSITSHNARNIKAWALVSGANNPVTIEAEKILLSREVLCVPDFVANSGGVLGGTMAFAGIGKLRIIRFLTDSFQPVYTDLFISSEKQGISIREYAEKLALSRHRQIKTDRENPAITGKIFQLGLSCYRAGLIPQSLTGRISLPYFANLPVFRGYEHPEQEGRESAPPR